MDALLCVKDAYPLAFSQNELNEISEASLGLMLAGQAAKESDSISSTQYFRGMPSELQGEPFCQQSVH